VFTEHLDRVLNETPGALTVTLMGYDGIAIETREKDAAQASDVNPHSAIIELSAIAKELKRVSEGLGAGDLAEVAVQTGGITTVLRPINHEFFLALALAPGAMTGKGRYLMRIVAPKLIAALA
jgi:predicted regulator of Ras-like GTPase activity (Roadblock/LC7/MglB family)